MGARSKTGVAARPEVRRDIVPSPKPADASPAQIAREFQQRLGGGAVLRPAGTARRSPRSLLRHGYTPRYRVDLFDFVFYLTDTRQNPTIRFFVAYVVPPASSALPFIYPRLFYKDVSLVWRVASHFVRVDGAIWIGKGEVRTHVESGLEVTESLESTTDLPLELQAALDNLSRRAAKVPTDHAAIPRILRQGPPNRIAAYADFTEPRRRARATRGRKIHGGRPIARFTRKHDPASLVFAAGFEPDFGRGVLERTESTSRLYGGTLARYRILSTNREIQYLFFAGPRHVWIAPPQATTQDLTTYGVRTLDVEADEDLSVPGYEYHFYDDGVDPPALVSQIPDGFAGEVSPVDDMRADASAWLDRLPVIQSFRRRVLASERGR